MLAQFILKRLSLIKIWLQCLPTFQTGGGPSSPKKHSRSNRYCPSRSNKDSSLFRLIVTLQLCLVRIEEANTVLCNGSACAPARAKGRPRSVSFQSKNSGFVPRSSSNVSSSSYWIKASNSDDSSELSTQSIHHSSSSELGSRERSDWRRSKLLAVVTLSLGGTYYLTTSTKSNETSLHNSKFFAISSRPILVLLFLLFSHSVHCASSSSSRRPSCTWDAISQPP